MTTSIPHMGTTAAIWKKSILAHSPPDARRFDLPGSMSLHQDPRWLATLAHGGDKHVERLVLEQSGTPAGWATFLVHPSALRIAFSDWTLYARPIRRYTLFAPPLLDPDLVTDESASLLALFGQLRDQLNPDEVLFLESVVDGSPLAGLLANDSPLRRQYHILEYGERYAHRYIDFTGDYIHYLGQLSASTRSDLKRTRKRFIAEAGGYRTVCYRDPDEVGAFLDAAMAVSARTYQYKLLGGGLRSRALLEDRYGTTANLGWFRSYVLFVNEQPIAFQVGHLYRGCYHAQEIGYDPEWSKLQVGIFLHTEIVPDLLATPRQVQRFDFGNDDNLHKQRLSNAATFEGYFYLIPRHWRSSLITHAMRTGNWISITAGRLLERYGLRKRMRKLLWKLGVVQ